MTKSSSSYIAVGEETILYREQSGDLAYKSRTCQRLANAILQYNNKPTWFVDIVPSYETVMLHFDGLQIDHHQAFQWLLQFNNELGELKTAGELILPICYDLDRVNDFVHITAQTGLTAEEVITAHLSSQYTVYAIGFSPGFAYMGFTSPMLTTPRLRKPRTRVPQGAVAIADSQTAVYPSESPGGWNIIGYCPLKIIQPSHTPPSPFSVGQQVSFKRIDADMFNHLSGKYWHEVSI